MTSQVLGNESSHHGPGEERGYFHFIREENKKRGQMAYLHFERRPGTKLSTFPLNFFLIKMNSFLRQYIFIPNISTNRNMLNRQIE